MEDNDEFGDLYADVLRPFTSTSASSDAPQLHWVSLALASLTRLIDLNLKSNDDEILFGAPHANPTANNCPFDQTLAPRPTEIDSAPNSVLCDKRVDDFAGWSRVLDEGRVELPKTAPLEDVMLALSRSSWDSPAHRQQI